MMIRRLLSALAHAVTARAVVPATTPAPSAPTPAPADAPPRPQDVDVVRARADLAALHVRQRDRKKLLTRARALGGRAGRTCGRLTPEQVQVRDDLLRLREALDTSPDMAASITRLCQLVAWSRGRIHMRRVRLPDGDVVARGPDEQAADLAASGYMDDYRKDVGGVR